MSPSEPLRIRAAPPPAGALLQELELTGQALELSALVAQAAGYARGSRAPNTRRAYASDWRHFTAWCATFGQSALPAAPGTVCLYLTAHAGILRNSTLHRRLICISGAHQAAGEENPTRAPSVKSVWAGIVRAHHVPIRRKAPLVLEAMRAVLDQLGGDPRDARDRALLLLAWGGALRRSEVVALRRADVEEVREGLVLTIRQGKTDQEGVGRQIGLPYGRTPRYCPVAAWRAWQALWVPRSPWAFTEISDRRTVGLRPLDDVHVARLVKRVCALAGLEGDYSGHSLRAGFATAAAAAGASERAIMQQTGHRSLLIARTYIRPATLFQDNAAAIAAL